MLTMLINGLVSVIRTQVFANATDIINRLNTSHQIYHVLCIFNTRDPFLKLKLLTPYSYSIYRSVLWDLSHEEIHVMLGVRVCSDLSAEAHNRLFS
jgi:hypothetical protein